MGGLAFSWGAFVERLAAYGVAALLVTGCSGSTTVVVNNGGGDASTGGDGASGGPSAAIVQACSDNSHAACTKMQTCTPANLEATYGNEATCELRTKATCLDAHVAPSTGVTSVRTENCAQAYANYSCTDYRNKTNLPLDCQQSGGGLMNGASCEYSGQCQSAFCAITPGSACGMCATPPAPGDSCASLTNCGDNLTCTSDTLTCVILAALGDACGAGVPCGAGLSCVAPGGSGTAGTCQTAGAQTGAACDGSMKTGPGCDTALSLYCDGLTKQCAQITYAGAGQPCGYDATTGLSFGCTSGMCVGSGGGQMGACVARAGDQQACAVPDGGASTTFVGCLPSARCVSSGGAAPTCQVVSAAGCM